MKDSISVGHPFYFPTQVALVDDDPEFLDGISLMLDADISHKLFPSALEALDYMNTAHKHVGILKRCYASYKTGPMASDSLTHIDIGKIHQEVLNPDRFKTVSTLVIDYSMPEMNGLEFLASLKNPFVKKILLTGRGDMEMAVRAFNSQLIDQFIDKHDPNLKTRLNAAIGAFQDQYFRNSFKLVTDQILANSHDAFLSSQEFQHYFADIRKQYRTVEYYLMEEPHSGFMLVDADGKCHMLLIHTDESLAEHRQLVKTLNGPEALQAVLNKATHIPAYDDKVKSMARDCRFFTNWKDYYKKAECISSRQNYYVAVYPLEQTPFVNTAEILSFNTFQQNFYPANAVFH